MSALKLVSRVAAVVVGIAVAGFLAAGIVTWRVAATANDSGAATPAGIDADTFKAFVVRRSDTTNKPEPSVAIADLKMQALLLDEAVGMFRDRAAVVAETRAMAALPQVRSGALDDLLEGEVSADYPYIWSYLMAGAIAVTGNALADEPIAAYYNPYFDVALFTKWRFVDNRSAAGFQLVEAVVVSGRAFLEQRTSLATDQPVWTDSKALFEVRIVNAAQNFVAAFEKRYRPLGRKSVALPADVAASRVAVAVAEDRVFYMLRWVIDAQNPAAAVNYAAAIKQLRGALAADSPGALKALLPQDNPQPADAFFQLDVETRVGMKPYLVVDTHVIFIDPINLPTGFISVYFEPSEQGFVPALMSLFSLGASYPDGGTGP